MVISFNRCQSNKEDITLIFFIPKLWNPSNIELSNLEERTLDNWLNPTEEMPPTTKKPDVNACKHEFNTIIDFKNKIPHKYVTQKKSGKNRNLILDQFWYIGKQELETYKSKIISKDRAALKNTEWLRSWNQALGIETPDRGSIVHLEPNQIGNQSSKEGEGKKIILSSKTRGVSPPRERVLFTFYWRSFIAWWFGEQIVLRKLSADFISGKK